METIVCKYCYIQVDKLLKILSIVRKSKNTETINIDNNIFKTNIVGDALDSVLIH